MVQKFYPNISILFVIALLFNSCNSEKSYEVDISNQQHDITVYRLDKALFDADTTNMKSVNQKLIDDLGELYDFYVAQMVQSGSVYDPAVHLYLNRFVSDTVMQMVVKSIDQKFGDFSDTKNSTDSLFRHFKYYFPKDDFPDTLVVYNSVFTNGVISTGSQIGLGAEMYLGPDNKVVQKLPGESFPTYFKNKMDAQFIVRDIAESWLTTHYITRTKEEDFLSYLIYYGKIQYALNCLMPNYSDAVKMRYFKEEWEWCEDNEVQIWKYLVDQKWVYTKKFKVIRNFFNDAPFTAGLPEGASPKAGVYIGKKIVEDFMEAHPEIELPELIEMDNNRKILKSYHPKE